MSVSKNISVFSSLILLIVCFTFSNTEAQPTSDLMREAQQLFEQNNEEEALALYKEVLEENPNNFEAVWRASFLNSRVGNRQEDQQTKENYYFNAMRLAERAIQLDSTDVNAHYALGVALGRRAEMSNAKQRVASTRKLDDVTDRGLSIDPSHAGLLHVKGVLYYEISTASTLETTAANMLFGGFPQDVSLEKSIDLLERAVDNRPDYLLYRLDLGKAYAYAERLEEAKEMFNSVLEKPALTPDDNNIKQQAREELAQL